MATPPNDIVSSLGQAKKVLVATHIFPDGDALGSQLALGDSLASLGKEVFLYSEEKVSHLYDFLPGCERLQGALPDLDQYDCVVAVDCADQKRLGKEVERLLAVKQVIMIDHHAGHKLFGHLQWVDPARASTGEMIYDLIVALGTDISPDAAYCLYTAIVSDTGSFMYSSTTADTFRVVSELVALGVKPAEVAGKLFENFTVNRLQLLQLVLDSLEMISGGRVAIITVTREMFAKTGAVPADTENFINYPRAVASVRVAAFIKETRDGVVSVSLRSKDGTCDVAELAASYGGGGHTNAAGFKIRAEDSLSVKEDLLPKLRELVAGL